MGKLKKIEPGVRDWLKAEIKACGGQIQFAEKMGISKDRLNKKLNDNAPIFEAEWAKWFEELMGYKWDERLNRIPRGLSDEDYQKKVDEILYGKGIDCKKFSHINKVVHEGFIEFADKRLTESECCNFIKFLNSRYILLMEESDE